MKNVNPTNKHQRCGINSTNGAVSISIGRKAYENMSTQTNKHQRCAINSCFRTVGAIAHYIMVKTDSTKGAVSISIGRKAYEKCEPKQISTKGAESIPAFAPLVLDCMLLLIPWALPRVIAFAPLVLD